MSPRYTCARRPRGPYCGHQHATIAACLGCTRRYHLAIVRLDGRLLSARELGRWARAAERRWRLLRP